MKKFIQITPIAQISLGIVCMFLSLVMVSDTLFAMLPDRHKQQIESRRFGSQVIVGQINALLASGDISGVQNLIDRLTSDGSEIQSIGVRRADETMLAATSNHAVRWVATTIDASSTVHVIVPLTRGTERWGTVELIFVDKNPHTILGFVFDPSVILMLFLSTVGLLAVYFYLRRALHYIDPSKSVPQRVRNAFDTLTEAVLIISIKDEVMLANTVFQKMASIELSEIEGKSIANIDWFVAGIAKNSETDVYPWQAVLRSNIPVQGKEMTVTLPDGVRHELIMNCSAINDGSGIARGCLITIEDVTSLHEANTALQNTLKDLEMSRDKIQEQNEELKKHAHYDYLTGCLNRRVFFEQAEVIVQRAAAENKPLFCIMSDIDHFKFFNDKFGHPVGDAVIQSVASALRRSLRNGDLLCRYGGEEFCILLPNADEKTGLAVAERIRLRIRAECGGGVRSVVGLQITSSVGVAPIASGDTYPTVAEMIELADQGLYVAKKSGRNRVAYADGKIHSGEDPPPQVISKEVSEQSA